MRENRLTLSTSGTEQESLNYVTFLFREPTVLYTQASRIEQHLDVGRGCILD